MILISTYTAASGRISVKGKKKLGPNNFVIVEEFQDLNDQWYAYQHILKSVKEKMATKGLVEKVDYKFV